MTISLRLAGAATLCAALLVTGCAKKSTDQTTSSDQTTTTTTGASPAAGTAASGAPAAAATAAAAAATAAAAAATAAAAAASAAGEASTTTTVSTGAPGANGSGAFIELPVYPGASESKNQELSMSANGTSVTIKVYSTKDDAKKVSDWYKNHLPSSWQSNVMTSGDKTVGTFTNAVTNGDQSVVVANNNAETRIQLTTKHGK